MKQERLKNEIKRPMKEKLEEKMSMQHYSVSGSALEQMGWIEVREK